MWSLDTNKKNFALSLLIQQYKGQPNIAGIVEACTNQCEDLESALVTLQDALNIDLAEGVQLDTLGVIVGESRKGREDFAYRLALKARIRLNISSGTPEQVIDTMTAVTGFPVVLREEFPAGFTIIVQAPIDPNILNEASALLTKAKPSAVAARLEYTINPFSESFSFGEIGNTDNEFGFGDSSDPDVGGKLAGVIGA